MFLMFLGKVEDVLELSQWMLCVFRGVFLRDVIQWNNYLVLVMENDIVFYFLLWFDRKGDKFNVYFKFKD